MAGALQVAEASAPSEARPATPEEPPLAIGVRGSAGQSLRRAVLGARRRLADPSCRQVLTDFSDASGRPLAGALADLGLTPAEYLSFVIFYDGTFKSRCASGEVLAGTTPGSRVVWVCARSFRVAEARDARLAEALVIHEVLHTLGLGENPPTSTDITQTVRRRCRETPNDDSR